MSKLSLLTSVPCSHPPRVRHFIHSMCTRKVLDVVCLPACNSCFFLTSDFRSGSKATVRTLHEPNPQTQEQQTFLFNTLLQEVDCVLVWIRALQLLAMNSIVMRLFSCVYQIQCELLEACRWAEIGEGRRKCAASS